MIHDGNIIYDTYITYMYDGIYIIYSGIIYGIIITTRQLQLVRIV